MTKREICFSKPRIAYYSGFCGFEVHDITPTHIIGVAGVRSGKKTYHRLKIYYDCAAEPFILLHDYRMYLRDFIREQEVTV